MTLIRVLALVGIAGLAGCSSWPTYSPSNYPSQSSSPSYSTPTFGDPYLSELREQNYLLRRQVEAEEEQARALRKLAKKKRKHRRDSEEMIERRTQIKRIEEQTARLRAATERIKSCNKLRNTYNFAKLENRDLPPKPTCQSY